MDNFGKRFREIRISKGLSQLDISRMTGISRGYIGVLETNRLSNPSIKVANKLLFVCGYRLKIVGKE